MTKPLSSERQRELNVLPAVILTIIDFHASREEEFGESTAPAVRQIADAAWQKRAVSDLRQIRDELVGMTEALHIPGADLQRLQAMLRDRAGVSLDQVLAERYARIGRVRRTGRITTEAQYYLVKERVESIWYDPAHAEEIEELKALMAAYEEHAAKGHGRR